MRRGFGLGFISILIAALIAAWLAVGHFKSDQSLTEETQQNVLEESQDLVDQLNQAQQDALDVPDQ